jgi:hypothetical protein
VRFGFQKEFAVGGCRAEKERAERLETSRLFRALKQLPPVYF